MNVKETLEKLRRYLFARKHAYQTVFRGPYGEKVLADLAKFCRANQSSFHADERMHAVLEGRREVFLRIQHQLRLTQEQVWELYGRKDLE